MSDRPPLTEGCQMGRLNAASCFSRPRAMRGREAEGGAAPQPPRDISRRESHFTGAGLGGSGSIRVRMNAIRPRAIPAPHPAVGCEGLVAPRLVDCDLGGKSAGFEGGPVEDHAASRIRGGRCRVNAPRPRSCPCLPRLRGGPSGQRRGGRRIPSCLWPQRSAGRIRLRQPRTAVRHGPAAASWRRCP